MTLCAPSLLTNQHQHHTMVLLRPANRRDRNRFRLRADRDRLTMFRFPSIFDDNTGPTLQPLRFLGQLNPSGVAAPQNTFLDFPLLNRTKNYMRKSIKLRTLDRDPCSLLKRGFFPQIAITLARNYHSIMQFTFI